MDSGWTSVAFTIVIVGVLAATTRSVSSALSPLVLVIGVASASLATIDRFRIALLPLAAACLVAFALLLVRRREAFRHLRPRRATSVVVTLVCALVLFSSACSSTSALPHTPRGGPRCARVIVAPGGYFRMPESGYWVTGPGNAITGCEIQVTDGTSQRSIPLARPLSVCGPTGVLLCHDAMTVENAGTITRYAFPSLTPLDVHAVGPPRSFYWLAVAGLMISLVAFGAGLPRRARVEVPGPYRGGAAMVTDISAPGISAASVAALVLTAPLTVAFLGYALFGG